MRRIPVVLLLVVLALLLLACGAQPDTQPPTAVDTASTIPTSGIVSDQHNMAGDCANPAVLCIGLVTDLGEVYDKSFNQSAWEGVEQAKAAFEANIAYIETVEAKDYPHNIRLFAENDYDVIVTVGFALGVATNEAAANYPHVHFIGVDQFQETPLPNVAGLIFEEDKAGFMAGVLAAQLSTQGTIAAVLGTDLVPPVVAFKQGYAAGARYINPDITIISTYHPGAIDDAFTDPEWGAATARAAIDQGADVVFAAAGNTGNGALIETATTEGVYCIGVDTDQWFTLPEAHNCLVSSAMKEISLGVFDLIAQEVAGELPSGNYVGSVGLAPFHAFEDAISPEINAKLQEVQAGLASGIIETGYTP